MIWTFDGKLQSQSAAGTKTTGSGSGNTGNTTSSNMRKSARVSPNTELLKVFK